ncbi:hypothetical protein FA95DRAFT_1683534 [Auriscalpium vulgare]|uniref:Uncharacterized protein n=1 Tax=Auriscalpium vulgare TaxID=40419 RepID=A0ACB8RA83_9AGAM|nr:hypothetical protein FA95DRAFT_1683534 [Auriscalpium vulgare]
MNMEPRASDSAISPSSPSFRVRYERLAIGARWHMRSLAVVFVDLLWRRLPPFLPPPLARSRSRDSYYTMALVPKVERRVHRFSSESMDFSALANEMLADPGYRDSAERDWARNQKAIAAAGYMLRPRYHEDRTFSGRRWKLPRSWFEDWQTHYVMSPIVIDATSMVDGKQVMLKDLSEASEAEEIEITQLFSSEEHRRNPKNHCIPVIEVTRLEDISKTVLVVPRMRPYNNPRFRTFGEVVAFATQIIEGLEFMHALHIAHRDCTGQNIVLDPSGMYPNSFHPVKMNRSKNFLWFAKSYTRTQRPPRYFLIDFGLSRYYDPARGAPLDHAIRGGDKSVPEFRGYPDCPPHNPFQTDIYYLGNLLRTDFIQKYVGFEWLEALVGDMCHEDPSMRPPIGVVASQFAEVSSTLTTWKLRSRLVGRKDSFIFGPYRWIRHVYRTTGYILTRTPAVPMPRDDGQPRDHNTSKVE